MTAPRARGFTAGTGVPVGFHLRRPDLALTSYSPPLPQPGMEAREPTRVPSLSRRHVPRPRLTRALDASTAQAILLIAPAGFGKTSLACEWLAGRENVYWYRATSASADLAAFSVGIAEVMASVAPGAAERLRQRLRVGELPEKAARPLAEMLAEDLVDWPPGAILVVDDYHLVIDSAPVEEFVDWLLTHLVRMQLLVTARRRPAWASARRVLYGEITEITADHLTMTDREASSVLSEQSNKSVRALVAQADGWPALVGLAAIASSTEVPTEHVSRELFRYLADEVVRHEPSESQEFMLLASLPSSISRQLVEEVLEIENAHALTQQLLRDGLLHESGVDSLAFHPILRDYLCKRLEAERPDDTDRLRSRLIDYARDKRDWDMAFDLVRPPRFVDHAALIAAEASEDLLAAGRVETLERWLNLCGAEVMRTPAAVVAKAEILMRRGHLAEAAVVIEIAIEQLEQSSPLMSRAYCLGGQIAHLRSDAERALELHRLGRECAERPTDYSQAVWGMILAAAELESQEAGEFLDQLVTAPSDDIELKLRVAFGRTLLGRQRGSLEGAWSSLEPLISIARYANDPMIRTGFLTWASFVAILNGEYGRGCSVAREAEAICETYRLRLNKVYCALILCHALIGANELRTAKATLELLVQESIADEDAYVRASFSALSLRLAFADGRAQVLPYPIILPYDHLPAGIHGELCALIAIAAAARGDAETTRHNVAAATAITQISEVRYLARYAELILATVEDGQPTAGTLSQLVTESACAGVIDTYVSAYRACPLILQPAVEDDDTLAITRHALVASRDRELAQIARINLSNASAVSTFDGLSSREREVLLLLAEGSSNSDIASRLVIAESTAKVHVHNILKKLGVRTRLQAALLARDLPREDADEN